MLPKSASTFTPKETDQEKLSECLVQNQLVAEVGTESKFHHLVLCMMPL